MENQVSKLTNASFVNEKTEKIFWYLNAYNKMDVEKMIADFDDEIIFQNIINGEKTTHLVQLLPIQNLEKRAFYELECIRQAWSVGELKRQINTLYYERSGISKKPYKLSKIINRYI